MAAAVVAVVVVGCGGSADDAPRRAAGGGNRLEVPGTQGAQLALGRHVFANACSACHTLEGAGRPHGQGGALDGYTMSAAYVRLQTQSMPLRRPLSERELRAVAAYVVDVQKARRRGYNGR